MARPAAACIQRTLTAVSTEQFTATGAQAQWQPGRGPRPPEIPEKRACYAAACRDARE